MNLTTLGNLKSWLNVSTTTDDALLGRLITQVSGMIYAYLQRPSFIQATYTDVKNGSGTRRVWLDNWPVLSVSNVQVGALIIPVAPNSPPLNEAGWYLSPWNNLPPGDPQTLDLQFYEFRQGIGNVAVTYQAGYVVQNEAQTVPSTPFEVTPLQLYGSWLADSGVTYATTGIAFTKIASGTPAAGQYVAPVFGGIQYYQFAAADAGQNILLNYSYVPAPIEQACIEWAGERYRYRDRIGQTSKSIGGQETAAYSIKGMPEVIAEMLDPYRRLVQDFQV